MIETQEMLDEFVSRWKTELGSPCPQGLSLLVKFLHATTPYMGQRKVDADGGWKGEKLMLWEAFIAHQVDCKVCGTLSC